MASQGQDQFKVVASGFLHLLVSQVASRLVSFVLNLFTARRLSPEAYGLASVQFHLITTTILLLSREGFRRGCLRFGRQAHGGAIDSWSVLKVAGLCVPIGLVVTTGVCLGVLGYQQSAPAGAAGQVQGQEGGSAAVVADEDAAAYRQAVLLHGVSAVVELLAEPFYILASVHLAFRVRMLVDMLGTFAKSGVTLVLVYWPQAPPSAVVFGLAQLALSVVVLLGYGAYGWRLLRKSAKPAREGKQQPALLQWSHEEKDVLWTSGVFALQAAEKLALGEGSKFILAAVQSRTSQGVYGLVANLGSLAVRVVFQPLEEAAFAAFSTWGSGTAAAAAGGEGGGGAVQQRDATAASHAKPNGAPKEVMAGRGGSSGGSDNSEVQRLSRLADVLGAMMKAVLLLGLLTAVFGPSYSYTALRLVYGTRWSESDAPSVLAAYSQYILLLALNGISESFVHAVLDARGLAHANMALLATSAAHIALCAVAVPRYGALGLVAADSVNMVLRIGYALWCIRRFFFRLPGFSLRQLLPATNTLAAAAVVALAAEASNTAVMRNVQRAGAAVPQAHFLRKAVLHVGLGGVLLAVLLGFMISTERSTLQAVRRLRHHREKQE